MRIAVDLDGVLADTIATFCRILNERRSTHITAESLDRWSAWQVAGTSKDEFFKTLDEAWFQWKTVPPTEQNLAAKVAQVARFGTVDIVTGRSTETVALAKSWLKQHNIKYNAFVRTISTNAKANLNYDIFVDDSPELMFLLASKLVGWGILYTRPWNRRVPQLPRISKVERWDEIPKVLQQIHSAKKQTHF